LFINPRFCGKLSSAGKKKCGSTKKRVSFFAFSRLLSKSKKKKHNKTPLNQFCPKIVATIQLPHTANNKIIPNQPPPLPQNQFQPPPNQSNTSSQTDLIHRPDSRHLTLQNHITLSNPAALDHQNTQFNKSHHYPTIYP
jgi:hypothetical protein